MLRFVLIGCMVIALGISLSPDGGIVGFQKVFADGGAGDDGGGDDDASDKGESSSDGLEDHNPDETDIGSWDLPEGTSVETTDGQEVDTTDSFEVGGGDDMD